MAQGGFTPPEQIKSIRGPRAACRVGIGDGGGNIVKDLTGHGYDAVGGSSNPRMMDTKWM